MPGASKHDPASKITIGNSKPDSSSNKRTSFLLHQQASTANPHGGGPGNFNSVSGSAGLMAHNYTSNTMKKSETHAIIGPGKYTTHNSLTQPKNEVSATMDS